jgi:hypothetical protein
MRKFTTEHTVYTFDELSDDAKQTAIEHHRDFINDTMGDFLEVDMDDKISELFKQYKITPVNIQLRYSLGYSQGDGASFTGDIEWGAYRATIGTNHWGIHYQHSKTVDVKEMNSLKTDKDAPDKKWSELQNIVETIGNELAKYGYDCIETQLEDENVIDSIKINEYEFNEDGTIA